MRKIMIEQPGNYFFAERRFHGRISHHDLAAFIFHSEENRVRGDFRLIDRASGSGLLRHLVFGPDELSRVRAGMLTIVRRTALWSWINSLRTDSVNPSMACLLAQWALCSGIERKASADPTWMIVPRLRGRICAAQSRAVYGTQERHFDDVLEFAGRHLFERTVHRHHRVIDPEVNRPELLLGCLRGGLHLIELADVGGNGYRASATVFNLPLCRFKAIASAHEQSDLGAAPGNRAVPADAS